MWACVGSVLSHAWVSGSIVHSHVRALGRKASSHAWAVGRIATSLVRAAGHTVIRHALGGWKHCG